MEFCNPFVVSWILKAPLGIVAAGARVSFLALPRTLLLSRRCLANDLRGLGKIGLTEVSREDRLLFKCPYFGEAGSGQVVLRA